MPYGIEGTGAGNGGEMAPIETPSPATPQKQAQSQQQSALRAWLAQNRPGVGGRPLASPGTAGGFGSFSPSGSVLSDVYGGGEPDRAREALNPIGKQGLGNYGGMSGAAAETLHGLHGFQV